MPSCSVAVGAPHARSSLAAAGREKQRPVLAGAVSVAAGLGPAKVTIEVCGEADGNCSHSARVLGALCIVNLSCEFKIQTSFLSAGGKSRADATPRCLPTSVSVKKYVPNHTILIQAVPRFDATHFQRLRFSFCVVYSGWLSPDSVPSSLPGTQS